jgi:polar amino acid transport system ATP-binding protein
LPSADTSPALLQIRGLRKRFGTVEILKGVDLDVRQGEVVSVIGSSGSGKTTLLRCVNLLEEFEGGEVLLDGEAVGYRPAGGRRVRLKDRELARQRAKTGMVFQSFNLFPHLTAAGNVMLGLRKVKGMAKAEARAVAETWLGRVGLAERVDHAPVNEVLATVKQLAADGATLLLVTHEMRFARDVSDTVVFMDKGQVAEKGPPAAIFGAPQHPRLVEFLRGTRDH